MCTVRPATQPAVYQRAINDFANAKGQVVTVEGQATPAASTAAAAEPEATQSGPRKTNSLGNTSPATNSSSGGRRAASSSNDVPLLTKTLLGQ